MNNKPISPLATEALSFQNSYPNHPLAKSLHNKAIELSRATPYDAQKIEMDLRLMLKTAKINSV